MQKVKPILPSQKEKKRYLVYEVITKKKLDKDPSKQIVAKAKRILGLFDSSEAGIQPVTYDKKKQRGVVRVNYKYVNKLKTSLMLMNSTERTTFILKTIGVSGILRKAYHKYIAG
jgi:RNase P/RNase MRP subunit POP5